MKEVTLSASPLMEKTLSQHIIKKSESMRSKVSGLLKVSKTTIILKLSTATETLSFLEENKLNFRSGILVFSKLGPLEEVLSQEF